MTEQKIIDLETSNKTIAEFMGFYFRNETICQPIKGWITGLETMTYDAKTYLKFHSSYDWLIPVVEKIESLQLPYLKYSHSIEVIISRNQCVIEYSGYEMGTICEVTANTKIEAVYNACVEFIKLLNNK